MPEGGVPRRKREFMMPFQTSHNNLKYNENRFFNELSFMVRAFDSY